MWFGTRVIGCCVDSCMRVMGLVVRGEDERSFIEL